MIKFKYKKDIHESEEKGVIFIYYNFFDLFLGVVLLILSAFFIHNYLSHELRPAKSFSPNNIPGFPANAVLPVTKSLTTSP